MNDNYINNYISLPYEDNDIKIEFAGDIICNKSTYLKTHLNNGYELCLIAHGKGFFAINDVQYAVNKDMLFITRPDQPHSAYPSADQPYRIRYVCFNIKQTALDIWLQIQKSLDTLISPVCIDSLNLLDLHKKILDEMEKNGIYSQYVLGLMVKEFIVLAFRNFIYSNQNFNVTIQNRLSQRIMLYIDSNLKNEICLHDIAEKFGYSVPHICKVFKKDTGFTVIEYYNYIRLEHSKTLLRGGLSISEIAIKLNYNDIHHFSNSFKNMYGVSPKTWRLQEHNNLYINDNFI